MLLNNLLYLSNKKKKKKKDKKYSSIDSCRDKMVGFNECGSNVDSPTYISTDIHTGGGALNYQIFTSTGLDHDKYRQGPTRMMRNPLKVMLDPTALKHDAKKIYQNHANKVCRSQFNYRDRSRGFLCQDGINDRIRVGLNIFLDAFNKQLDKEDDKTKKDKFNKLINRKLVIYFERHGAALHNKIKNKDLKESSAREVDLEKFQPRSGTETEENELQQSAQDTITRLHKRPEGAR